MFKELYIPYADIKMIKQSIIFKTNGGQKYYLWQRNLKEWKETVKQIETRVVADKQ